MSLEKIKNLKQKMTDLRVEMKTLGISALQEAFNEFFKLVPEAEAITWTQYTPYFNDGDACTFGINELALKLNAEARKTFLDNDVDVEEEYGDWDEWLNQVWESDHYDLSKLPTNPRAQEISKIFIEFSNNVQDEDIFLSVFGDHVKVLVTRGDIRFDEYRHD